MKTAVVAKHEIANEQASKMSHLSIPQSTMHNNLTAAETVASGKGFNLSLNLGVIDENRDKFDSS